MSKSCERCGADFTPRSHRARFCSDKCRNAAGYARRNGATAPLALVLTAATAPADGTLTGVTMRDLTGLGLEHSIGGTLALLLARAIDSGQHTGSGMTSLTREYRTVMADVVAAAKPKQEDPLARLRRMREERRARGQTN